MDSEKIEDLLSPNNIDVSPQERRFPQDALFFLKNSVLKIFQTRIKEKICSFFCFAPQIHFNRLFTNNWKEAVQGIKNYSKRNQYF